MEEERKTIFCSKCGFENDKSANFCKNCGNKLEQRFISVNSDANVLNEKQEGNRLAVISLVLYFSSAILPILFSFLGTIGQLFVPFVSLCPIAGIVTMIIGRIKYPKNIFLKIVMWIFIVSIIFCIIMFIMLMVACAETCSSLRNSGC